MAERLLPPLRQDAGGHQIGGIVAGSWGTEKQADLLEHIGNALNIPDLEDHNYKVNSIPNMWARPLLFEMVLTHGSSHPMHKQVLGEWRGLLAMLALKERKNFPLTTKKVEIPSNDDRDAPTFLRALSRLFPNKTLDTEGATWETLYPILFNDKPIGVTSPTTLVCTSVNYAGTMSKESVPWYEDGKRLKDPVGDLDEEERIAVAAWLHKIGESIKPNDTTKKLCGDIIGLLDNFKKTLIGDDSIQDCEFSDNGFQLEGFFSCMDKPVLSLKGQKEYFTEKLFVIKQENAFKGCFPPNIHSDNLCGSDGETIITPILPIREKLLSKLYENEIDGESLNDRIVFEKVQDGIKVLLTSPEGELIFKVYRFSSDEIVEIDSLPVLEIWPNFEKESWKTYYTYFSRQEGQHTFYVEPFFPEGVESRSVFIGNDKDKITRTVIFPKAMLCQHKLSNGDSEEKIGVLLISVPESPNEPTGLTWTIGVDFGTTSTAVYGKRGTSGPFPIEYTNRVIQVTDSPDSNRLRVYENFFFPDIRQTPFFSFLHVGGLHANNQDGGQELLGPGVLDNNRSLLDGHIYFFRDYSKFNDRKKEGTIYSDLKWSTEPVDRNRLEIFLKQLSLQCAAEAVNEGATSIEWRYSYPKAFSGPDEERFKELWDKVTKTCYILTGLETTSVGAEPESIVIAKYFKNPQTEGTFTSGAVCIDIGGATSDISIWQGDELRSQTSLKFAGRDIFLKLLASNPQVLKGYPNVSDGYEEIETLAAVTDATENYVWADTLLEKNWENWLQYLFPNQCDAFPNNKFLQLVAIGLAGLLYYVGLLLKFLSEQKKITSDNLIWIYIGGKGSRILEWFGRTEDEKEFLNKILLDATGFEGDEIFRFVSTEKPKEEAAFGLVSEAEPGTWENTDHYSDLILAGESFRVNNEDREWTEIITSDLLTNPLALSNVEQFQKFVNSFNEHAEGVLYEGINHIGTKTLTAGVMEGISNMKKYGRIESFFTLALNSLLDEKIREWKKETQEKYGLKS